MESSQPHANAPTARQHGVSRGKASRRATPADLKQEPTHLRTRRRKSQLFEVATPGTQNTYLASFRKTAGFSESASEPGGLVPTRSPRLTASNIRNRVRTVRFGSANGDPRNPHMASFRKMRDRDGPGTPAARCLSRTARPGRPGTVENRIIVRGASAAYTACKSVKSVRSARLVETQPCMPCRNRGDPTTPSN
jgi:hypothetical protein